tara:strand:+ start:6727 stop:9603 length:2877 start_codon:yes stop_codon:yes gene_type:complete
VKILFTTLLFILISCTESTPELKTLGKNNINDSKNIDFEKSVYYITDPSESLLIKGGCDPRYTEMEASFDNGSTWKNFSVIDTSTTDDECSDNKFVLYLNAINNYFTYDSGVVGNQTKTILIRGNLGFTFSDPRKIEIKNGDFNPPATPTIRTLSSFAFARIYIDAISDTDFSHFECKVDNGSWFTCEDDQIITSDGVTVTEVGKRSDISVRSVDNSGNTSEAVTRPFIRGKIGRGVDGTVYDIVEYKKGQYLVAGNFKYHQPTPVDKIARFSVSDLSLDKSWNPDFNNVNTDIEQISRDTDHDYFIINYYNKAFIFDDNWSFLNQSDIVDTGLSYTRYYPTNHKNKFYTRVADSSSSTYKYYLSTLDNSDPSNPIYQTSSNSIDFSGWGASFASINLADNFAYISTGNMRMIDENTSDFCIKKFELDFSDHNAGTNVICNTPSLFYIDNIQLGVDTHTTAYIGKNMVTYGNDLFIHGDFTQFNGLPTPNCIMKYDGNSFSAFGEDLGVDAAVYVTVNKCTSSSSLGLIDNNIILKRYTNSSSASSLFFKPYKINVADESFTELTTGHSPSGEYIAAGSFYLNNSYLFDSNLNIQKDLRVLVNSTSPKSFYYNQYIYLFNDLEYANQEKFQNEHLLLIDETGNILKTFDIQGTQVNKILKYKDKFYIAGDFTQINNNSYKNLARLDSELTLDSTFPNLQFNGDVTDLTFDSENRMYVAGGFTFAKDVTGVTITNRYMIRYDSNFIYDNTFLNLNTTTVSNGSSPLTGMKLLLDETDSTDRSLYISGAFTTSVEGHETDLIVKLDLNGNIDTNFVINGSNHISDIAIAPNGTDLIVSRQYSNSNNLNGNGCELCVIDKNTGAFKNSLLDSSRDIWTIEVKDSLIFGMGERLLKFDQSYNQFSDLHTPSLYGRLYTFVLNEADELIIGGSFTAYANAARFSLVKLNSDFSVNQYSFGDWR